MDTLTSDFSNPPQWVLDMFDPETMPSHVYVSEGAEPDSYVIQEIDFQAMNPYAVPVSYDYEFPVKGQDEIFVGDKVALYEKLKSLDSKVILSRSVSKLIADGYLAAMAYGHSSDFETPALVCSSYKEFLKTQEAYKENPEQIGLAYNFINQHPMFWHTEKVVRSVRSRRSERNQNPEKSDQTEKLEIVTGQGWGHLQWQIFNKKNKDTGALETSVTIETGQGSWHDYNLDVYAPSFDGAVIELAKLIHTHYDSHGGFTDKTKKGPNDNFFREADAEMEAEESSE
jgi:hypothetical protein